MVPISAPTAVPTSRPTSEPTSAPSFSPTYAPTPIPTPPSNENLVVIEDTCFEAGCSVTATFGPLSEGLEQMTNATLFVELKGDLEAANEFASLTINGVPAVGQCPTNLPVPNCALLFAGEVCDDGGDEGFPVLNILQNGFAVVPLLDGSDAVDPECDDAAFTGYALRARFVLAYQCIGPATELGCEIVLPTGPPS
mmetsp:Transcript_14856/g.48468  ORF Transcript_14856/g.48468 Transcript_14856/m.48468 type:complete len:196 (+) Transcript_14856:348-935(+)